MKRLRAVGLTVVAVLLLSSAQASAAKPQPNKVKQTASGIRTLALDWPRVAYASGGRIYTWNVVTSETTVVKGNYSNATHTVDAAEVAIAGTRVAWIKRQTFGNTEESLKLYSASIAGKAHLRKQGYLFGRDAAHSVVGGWIAGVVGSGHLLAVSTWTSDGTSSSAERLLRITPTGMPSIVTGPGAIVAGSSNGGHIAVLRSTAAWPADEPATPATQPTVGVYSTDGSLLGEIVLATPIPPPPPPNPDSCDCYPSTIFHSIALSGNHLVALTETAPQNAPRTMKIDLFDWPTGTLFQTWPLALKPWATNLAPQVAAYGRFAAVEGRRLQVLDLTTGKVVMTAAAGNGSPAALDSHGLVYATAVGAKHGRLVFVPMSKLLSIAR
jgi:hypothetical protein